MWEQQYCQENQVCFWKKKRSWETTWVDPDQVNQEYYENIQKKFEFSHSYIVGKQKKSRKSSKPLEVLEDFPQLAIEREKYLQNCLDILARENEKYGIMQGNTKTANSCRKDGMKIGMQGIFARIVWYELLEQIFNRGEVGNRNYDSIITTNFQGDQAVIKEFIDAGRTPDQAEMIMKAVGSFLEKAAASLIQLKLDLLLQQEKLLNSQHIELTKGREKIEMFNLQYASTVQTITSVHLHKLLNLYHLHTDPSAKINDPIFLRRVFCVLSRYDTLSGKSDGYQMAFPDIGFKYLRDNFEAKVECFASPLNCWNQKFCSVSKDTDQFFGSVGNFFLFEGSVPNHLGEVGGLPIGGSFEANPPFVEAVMNKMAERIDWILNRFPNAPFSFIVIVPAWADCTGVIQMTNSKFNRPFPGFRLVLDKKKHDYRPGMQHRTTHTHQKSNVDTFVFFLQNELGSKTWPVTMQHCDELKKILEESSDSSQK